MCLPSCDNILDTRGKSEKSEPLAFDFLSLTYSSFNETNIAILWTCQQIEVTTLLWSVSEDK